VVIMRGRRSREKVVEVDGIDQATLDGVFGIGPPPSA